MWKEWLNQLMNSGGAGLMGGGMQQSQQPMGAQSAPPMEQPTGDQVNPGGEQQNGFQDGIKAGMNSGGGGGGAPTEQFDRQLAMQGMYGDRQYRDMSTPQAGMGGLMTMATRPQGQQQQRQQMPMNPYVQGLMRY